MDRLRRAVSEPSAKELEAARVTFTAELLARSPVDLITEWRAGWSPLGLERFPPCIGEDTRAMEFYDFMLLTTSQADFRYRENARAKMTP